MKMMKMTMKLISLDTDESPSPSTDATEISSIGP